MSAAIYKFTTKKKWKEITDTRVGINFQNVDHNKRVSEMRVPIGALCESEQVTKCYTFLPEASFGLQVLSLPVSIACLRDISGSIQARITKGAKQLGYGPYCFVEWSTLTLKVKVKIYPI